MEGTPLSTNVHPDNILIEQLEQDENPRAFLQSSPSMSNVTGNDQDINQIEKPILEPRYRRGYQHQQGAN